MRRDTGRRLPGALGALVVLLACGASVALAEDAAPIEYANAETPGVDEKLGQTIPTDLVFVDEAGRQVQLADLLDRPTVLTLVYYRCPGICSPLMNELANTVDEVNEVRPGKDYRILTISFDAREGPEIASTGKKSLFSRMKTEVPEDGWRFLTGDERNIAILADAVGFRFKRDKEDFLHAGSVMFLTKEGTIVRYLSGLELLPFDLKMAVNDAAEGTPRTLMQRVQQLCYAYDPVSKTYTLQVNRIILWVTLAGLGVFIAFLVLKRKRAPLASAPLPTDPMKGGAA